VQSVDLSMFKIGNCVLEGDDDEQFEEDYAEVDASYIDYDESFREEDEEVWYHERGFDSAENDEPDIDVGNIAADELLLAAGYSIKSLGSEPTSAPEEAVEPEETPVCDTREDGFYDLKIATQLGFERKGHCALPKLLDADVVADLAQVVDAEVRRKMIDGYRQKVEVLFGAEEASAIETEADGERRLDGVDLPFLQFFNMHESVPAIADVALSERIGRVAADLLGVDAVRLYQDAVFYKRSGDAATPWHADCSMMPVDGPVVTIFLPLRTLAGGKHSPLLRFASGSHRDMSAAYWFGVRAGEKSALNLSSRYPEEGHGPVALGGATAHHGFTLHSSPGIPSGSRARRALSLTYVAANARVLPKEQQALLETEDSWSYRRWLGNAKAGKPLKHKLLPVVYSRGTNK
jgi:Phytanoyl-CoA dioxygenase (PhyH)